MRAALALASGDRSPIKARAGEIPELQAYGRGAGADHCKPRAFSAERRALHRRDPTHLGSCAGADEIHPAVADMLQIVIVAVDIGLDAMLLQEWLDQLLHFRRIAVRAAARVQGVVTDHELPP